MKKYVLDVIGIRHEVTVMVPCHPIKMANKWVLCALFTGASGSH